MLRSPIYSLVLLLHVSSLFVYLLAHGISAGVSLRIPAERDISRLRSLLNISKLSFPASYGLLGIVVVTGFVLIYLGSWWLRGWPWAGMALLIAISISMAQLGTRYFNKLRYAAGMDYVNGQESDVPTLEIKPEDINSLLSQPNRPLVLSVIGISGVIVILWLMLLKQF